MSQLKTLSLAAAIASGAALSGDIHMGLGRAVMILMPAAWDAAALTFRVTTDGITYNNVYDSSGNEYTVQAAAGRAIVLSGLDFLGIGIVQIRSGTSGTPVNQSAARALTVRIVPVL